MCLKEEIKPEQTFPWPESFFFTIWWCKTVWYAKTMWHLNPNFASTKKNNHKTPKMWHIIVSLLDSQFLGQTINRAFLSSTLLSSREIIFTKRQASYLLNSVEIICMPSFPQLLLLERDYSCLINPSSIFIKITGLRIQRFGPVSLALYNHFIQLFILAFPSPFMLTFLRHFKNLRRFCFTYVCKSN